MHNYRIWVNIGILAVSLMWLVSALANGWAGWHLAKAPELGAILAGASVAADILKAVMLFVISAAIINRRWVVMCVAVLVFILCAGWSMRSATHFAASLYSGSLAERTFNQQIQTDERGLLGIKTNHAKALSGQTVKIDPKARVRAAELAAEANASTERAYHDAIKAAEEGLARIQKMGAQEAGDPLAGLLHVEDESMILATSLFFAGLLEVVSASGCLPGPATSARRRQPSRPRR